MPPARTRARVGDAPALHAPIAGRWRKEIAERESIGQALLVGADVAALVLSLAILAIAGLAELEAAHTLAMIGVLVVVTKLSGLYDRDEMLVHRTTIDECPDIVRLATRVALVAWLLDESLGNGTFDRYAVVGLWLAFIVLAALGRYAARAIGSRMAPAERCLVVGPGIDGLELDESIKRAGAKAAVVATVAPEDIEDLTVEELRWIVNATAAHRIVLAGESATSSAALDVVRAAKIIGVRVSLMPQILQVVGTQVEFDHVAGSLLLGVRTRGLGRSARAVKRVFDICVATVSLMALSPLLVAIAMAIKMDSRGRVFYRQPRVGRRGRSFEIFKFRTMVVGAHEQWNELAGDDRELFKLEDDPRVTRMGALLRATSLDELPQLFNVLRGDMSIVGPRPLLAEEDALVTGYDRRRLDLTPGMTGHWQILGLGSARVPLTEMVRIDYRYVSGWTLWTDLKIILRTVPYVLSRRSL